MTVDTTILDMDSILDQTLDGVKDIPDYLNPPTGNYSLGVAECEMKIVEDRETKEKKPRFVLTYKVNATLELADPKADAVADGTLWTENFTYSEDGIAYFKKQAKKILNVENVDGVSIRDIMSSLKDVTEFKAKVQTRETAGKNGGVFTNSRVIPIWSDSQVDEEGAAE